MVWGQALNLWQMHGEPFTYDQARDLLEIRELAKGKDIKVLGPTTSLNGLHLGPVYYYLLLPGFWIGKGDPSVILKWQISVFYLTCLGMFAWGIKKQRREMVLMVLVISTAPVSIRISHYFWNAHWMIIAMVWLIITWQAVMMRPNRGKVISLGIIAGICLQLEAALGVILLPAILAWMGVKRIKQGLWAVSGFGLTLLPQGLYEATHGFQMTKLLFAINNGQILGTKLDSWRDLLADRIKMLSDVFKLSFSLSPIVSLICVVTLSIGVLMYEKERIKISAVIRTPVTWIGGWAILLYLVYPYPLKHWYTYGLCMVAIWGFCELISRSKKLLLQNLAILLAVALFINGWVEMRKFAAQTATLTAQNPSSLINQIAIIKEVGEMCGQGNYDLFTYTPGVYDFPYQYVALWLDKKNEFVRPKNMSYEPDVPAYIPNDNSLPWGRNMQNPVVCTIIDQGDEARINAWKARLSNYCVNQTKVYIFGTSVEKREKC